MVGKPAAARILSKSDPFSAENWVIGFEELVEPLLMQFFRDPFDHFWPLPKGLLGKHTIFLLKFSWCAKIRLKTPLNRARQAEQNGCIHARVLTHSNRSNPGLQPRGYCWRIFFSPFPFVVLRLRKKILVRLKEQISGIHFSLKTPA